MNKIVYLPLLPGRKNPQHSGENVDTFQAFVSLVIMFTVIYIMQDG
jgi:hypothetical protein